MRARWLLAFAIGALASPLLGQGSTADRWPTLSAQVEAAEARPGSAFAAFIARNQDFSVLHPSELKDEVRLPLWMRVHWRRHHPEMVYSPDDPSGGYPRALERAVEWMQAHQDLRPGPGDRPSEPPFEIESASVSGELRISGLQSVPRSDSDIRVNYWDPQKIIAASNNVGGSGQQGQYWSVDGGATWGQTELPLQPGDAFHSDPTVDWTSDGTAWATTIGIDAGVTQLRLRAYKSTDNGATWTFDATFSGAQTSADKQMMWVDHSASSPFQDNVYGCWHAGTPVFVNRRTGPAGSWQSPLQVSGAETGGATIGCDVKTNAAGDVFAFWPSSVGRKLLVGESTNGGVSFGSPVLLANTFGSLDIGIPSFNSRRALIYVSAGAYRTVTKDLVYASWTDLTGAAGCTTPANEPAANVASTCKTRIWFARSTNGGATWSPPVMINDQAGLNDQFNQWLAVDETTGALAVIYYDTVGDAGRKKTDVWYQSSFDDGVTWFPPVKVTTAMTDETVAGADGNNQYGNRNGLSGYAGTFFPSWTDRRNDAREEIWTARVTDPACPPPGAPAIGTATATGANQIQLTWSNGSPPSTTFNVYRAFGACASPGPFTLVGPGVAGSPFDDNAVSGGSTYAYRVTGLDVASCALESAFSGCVEATATGGCTLPPTFAGLASAANQATAQCGIQLAWAAAMPACSGPVTYRVYRSTTSGFVPGAGNLIASGVTGTGHMDADALSNGVTYYYVVRAVDSSNGAVEANTVEKSATPSGPVTPGTLVDTFEGALSGGGFDHAGWTHSAASGAVDWTWSTAQSQSPTHSWFSASQPSASDRVLASPSFVPQPTSTLSFWHTFNFETNGGGTVCYDGGTLEISTNGGPWTVMPDAAFTAGVFNDTVEEAFSNPIAGKRAWCQGTIGAMTQVSVDLSSFAGAADAKLRWHAGDDVNTAATGWYVDSVTLGNVGIAGACASGPPNEIFSSGFELGTLVPPFGASSP